MDWTSGKTKTNIGLYSQLNEPKWDLCQTYTARCCQNLSGNSWLRGDLLLLESTNTHHSRLEGVISTCEYIHKPARVTASTLYILNPTVKTTNVSMNWLKLSLQSPFNCRTDLTASHCKNQLSPSLSTYSPQVHITWFVYMPKHVSFLIPWLFCSVCNTCRSVKLYHKKQIIIKKKTLP